MPRSLLRSDDSVEWMPRSLLRGSSLFVFRWPFRSRDASVCPLDNLGLIRVRLFFSHPSLRGFLEPRLHKMLIEGQGRLYLESLHDDERDAICATLESHEYYFPSVSDFFPVNDSDTQQLLYLSNAQAHREPPSCVLSASAEPQAGGDAVQRRVRWPYFLSFRVGSLFKLFFARGMTSKCSPSMRTPCLLRMERIVS